MQRSPENHHVHNDEPRNTKKRRTDTENAGKIFSGTKNKWETFYHKLFKNLKILKKYRFKNLQEFSKIVKTSRIFKNT